MKVKGLQLNPLVSAVCLCLGLVVSMNATADIPYRLHPGIAAQNQNWIERNAFSNSNGVITLNMNSGGMNAQANSNVIAINPKGVSVVDMKTRQTLKGGKRRHIGSTHSGIKTNAFRHAKGIISINQASGTENLQSNSAAIAIGAKTSIKQAGFASIHAKAAKPHIKKKRQKRVKRSLSVANSAFKGARGIIQLNQSSGSRNISANRFSLQMSGFRTR